LSATANGFSFLIPIAGAFVGVALAAPSARWWAHRRGRAVVIRDVEDDPLATAYHVYFTRKVDGWHDVCPVVGFFAYKTGRLAGRHYLAIVQSERTDRFWLRILPLNPLYSPDPRKPATWHVYREPSFNLLFSGPGAEGASRAGLVGLIAILVRHVVSPDVQSVDDAKDVAALVYRIVDASDRLAQALDLPSL
jgi:hypothetical protein